MERFGFSAGLIAKIQVLYSNIESVLKVNGSLCAPFRVEVFNRAVLCLGSDLEKGWPEIQYLGVYLGNECMVRKNWENVVEASLLWHRLACLEPPPGLLSHIQAKLVNFFWDSYHWVPQLVERSLELWRRRLSVRERSLLLRYGRGGAEPDPTNAFPDLQLSPGCEKCSGPLLYIRYKSKLGLQAKLAIYLTRRDRIQDGDTYDVVVMWKQNIRARLRLEFCFYKATTNLEVFQQLWGHESVLCLLTEQRQLKLSNYHIQ
ncbi:hypothetical protein D4764_17G0006800 [Takifugu flavidus]|uniref:Uncharacterized protein n=1 Tax=Takifugu flavidus TaxID=433684 RepID=A0A5C6NZH3_9TELE|nr:hypothetical protein D4764_17G0006800 [Takifugu flavidus]